MLQPAGDPWQRAVQPLYKLTQDLPADARPLFETLFLDKLEELVAARRPDRGDRHPPLCAGWCPAGRGRRGSALPLITCVTDLSSHSEWIHKYTDCYLVGSNDIRSRLAAKGVDRDIICVTGIPVRCEFKRPVRRRRGRERNLLTSAGAGWACCPARDSFYEALDACPASHPPSSPATTASSTTAWRASMPTSRCWASPTGYTTTWPGRIWCSPSPAALPCLRPSSPSCPSWRGSPFWSRRRTTPASW